ncbi:MAG TPA: exodeoxyribonuclease VII large subunit, partial [Pyrinomonadaceae bacterium]|nr:exodeoxyribonuclease VII large subunit [Pyrinomonadaceae bacterium]
RNEQFALAAAKLDTLSPLAVLGRGYSITQTPDGRVVTDSEQVAKGDKITIRLGSGKLGAEVVTSE